MSHGMNLSISVKLLVPQRRRIEGYSKEMKVSQTNQSSKKLVLWLLAAAIVLAGHTSYVRKEREPTQTSYIEPNCVLVMYGFPNYEESEDAQPLYENFTEVQIDELQSLPYEPSDVKQDNSSSPTPLKTKDTLFHPIIIEVASRHQVDPALIKAIIMAESGYNPKAVSKRGAKGLMQLMPLTAKSLGVEDIFNPKHNINAGVGYFKKLLNQFDGDVKLALAAYNAGSRKVRQYKGIPPFRATKIYIKKVFKYYELYKEQM